jgi:hypothetical protein
MLFTHDTELNLSFLQSLANTVPESSESGSDELATTQHLDRFLHEWTFNLTRTCTPAELDAVKRVRGDLRAIWGADELDVVAWINRILIDARATPQLVNHDGLGWHVHATDTDAPLAERIIVEAAMTLIDVIRADRLDRLRDCEADDCGGLLVDLSKNGSKRFCSTRCGNRMAVRAYRARAAAP